MKKILLATDFSDNSNNAIEFAINMFGLHKAAYTLLNTYEEPASTSNVMVSISDILEKESAESLKKNHSKLLEKYKGIKLDTKSVYGDLARVIERMFNENHFDYVVLGARGMSRFEKFIMGSNTLNVIKKVKVPMIIIPEHSEYDGIHRIAFAADYENINQIHLLDPMVEIAKITKSEVLIVNVTNEDKPVDLSHAVEGFTLHGIMQDVKHHFYNEVNDNVADGLEKFIEDKKVGLITLVAHKYNFFERLVHKSVSKQISTVAEIPMLIIHE